MWARVALPLSVVLVLVRLLLNVAPLRPTGVHGGSPGDDLH